MQGWIAFCYIHFISMMHTVNVKHKKIIAYFVWRSLIKTHTLIHVDKINVSINVNELSLQWVPGLYAKQKNTLGVKMSKANNRRHLSNMF